jgi:hypothetical protein
VIPRARPVDSTRAPQVRKFERARAPPDGRVLESRICCSKFHPSAFDFPFNQLLQPECSRVWDALNLCTSTNWNLGTATEFTKRRARVGSRSRERVPRSGSYAVRHTEGMPGARVGVCTLVQVQVLVVAAASSAGDSAAASSRIRHATTPNTFSDFDVGGCGRGVLPASHPRVPCAVVPSCASGHAARISPYAMSNGSGPAFQLTVAQVCHTPTGFHIECALHS